MFFESWSSMGKTALSGILAYMAVLLFLRITGKRTLSKMNAFDLVVTVALGSTLATVMVSKQTPLADGITALFMLVILQYVVTWVAVRSCAFRRMIKSDPTLIYFRGDFIESAMKRERIVRDEIYAAAREQGVSDFAKVAAIVLETDGSFSVVKGETAAADSTLANVSK